MIEKLKTVYYCEFCSKKYFRRDHCAKHENKCTMNVNRECSMCNIIANAEGIEIPIPSGKMPTLQEYLSKSDYALLTEYQAAAAKRKSLVSSCADWSKPEMAQMSNNVQKYFEEVYMAYVYCPMCRLTWVRTNYVNRIVNYAYKTDLDAFWELFNEL